MPKLILIDAVYPDETRVVIYNNKRVQEFDYETSVKKQLKGNIYLAKITRVEPSLQAAFIDYGGDKHGFLPFSEIHPDYYQIPVSDRHDNGSPPESASDTVPENDLPITPGEIGIHIRAIAPPDLSSLDHEDEIKADASPEDSTGDVCTEEGDDEAVNRLPADEPVEHMIEHADDEEIDTIIGEDLEESSPAQSNLYRQYKIQEVIKRNQIILVQVIKEERGNKGASFTSYISLAGRYCVLMPNSERQGGISRRISDVEDRRRLKSIIESLTLPDGTSVIVRTAGQGRTKSELKRDFDYLVRLWNNIREHTLAATAPAFIHAEGDLLKRSIRDMYDKDTDEILVQGDNAYRSAKDFMQMILPSHVAKVKQYKSKVPIFCRYQVEDQISALYSPIATLKSGGYIVINPTEALISVDVNSGRSTAERNIEETATKTNIEAAYEVARQLKLRDLSGLIVIDFIDMSESRNRRNVERALKDALEGDSARIQIGRISLFGLLEMSRQRLRSSFLEANTVSCPHCNGRGTIRASESTAVMALRAIESEVYKGDCEAINVYASTETVIYILNFKRADIRTIEDRYGIRIFFHQDPHASADGFATEKIKRLTTVLKHEAAVSVNMVEPYSLEAFDEDETDLPLIEDTPPAQPDRKKRSWRQKSDTPKEAPRIEERAESDEVVIGNGDEPLDEERKGRRSRSNRRGGNRRNGRRPQEREASAPLEDAPRLVAPAVVDEESRRIPSKKSYRRPRSRTSSSDAPKAEGDSLLKGLWKRIID